MVYEESRKIPGEKPLKAKERTNNKQAATKHIVSLRNMPTYIVSPKGLLNERVGKRFELKKNIRHYNPKYISNCETFFVTECCQMSKVDPVNFWYWEVQREHLNCSYCTDVHKCIYWPSSCTCCCSVLPVVLEMRRPAHPLEY